MQQRFQISHHTDFPTALVAKEDQQKRNPDKHYQIRKMNRGFNLVTRVSVNEIQSHPERVIRTRRRR